jgi:predicted kinase
MNPVHAANDGPQKEAMMQQPLVHLICGGIGAGKTSYARALADETGGVLFSIDEWMATLFAADAPRPLEFAWVAVRLERAEEQIGRMAARLAAIQVPVVLDLGFQTHAQRCRYRDWAEGRGLVGQLHLLELGAEERWRRVQARNASRTGTFAFPISRDMFDTMEARWEPPAAEELDALHALVIDGRTAPPPSAGLVGAE